LVGIQRQQPDVRLAPLLLLVRLVRRNCRLDALGAGYALTCGCPRAIKGGTAVLNVA
jgi:hypothetical protein